jgi:hypothetical protein
MPWQNNLHSEEVNEKEKRRTMKMKLILKRSISALLKLELKWNVTTKVGSAIYIMDDDASYCAILTQMKEIGTMVRL